MTYADWLDRYKAAMNQFDILNNTCPSLYDDYVTCESCKIHDKCKFVIRIVMLQPN